MKKKTAYSEIMERLEEGEIIEAIIFGNWGWDGFDEPSPPPVPEKMRRKVLTLDEAKPLLKKFKFGGGFGAPETYAVRIFTNKRVFWVTQYDGATGLDSTIRNPIDGYEPDMPGG